MQNEFVGTLGERLKWSRETAGYATPTEAATAMGISLSTYYQNENGTREFGKKRAARFADFFRVDLTWLLTGKGAPRRRKSEAPASGIPVLGRIKAGAWREIDATIDVPQRSVPVAPDPKFSHLDHFALLVEGNSMNKVFADGDYVICIDFADSGLSLQDDDLVVAERARRGFIETTVKRVKFRKGIPELWPESTDDEHQGPIRITDGEDPDNYVRVRAFVVAGHKPLFRRNKS